jgi:hypothetical protein
MLTRILVPAGKGGSTPESAAYEAPYGVIRGEPS